MDVNCPFHEAFYQLHGWHSNQVTLIGESLTSHVVSLTPILAKTLTSDPYNCWPLLLRKSVDFSLDDLISFAGIYLDDFLPRIVSLCLNSGQRKTRVAACECLHAALIFLVGKSATDPSQVSSLTKIFH